MTESEIVALAQVNARLMLSLRAAEAEIARLQAEAARLSEPQNDPSEG